MTVDSRGGLKCCRWNGGSVLFALPGAETPTLPEGGWCCGEGRSMDDEERSWRAALPGAETPTLPEGGCVAVKVAAKVTKTEAGEQP